MESGERTTGDATTGTPTGRTRDDTGTPTGRARATDAEPSPRGAIPDSPGPETGAGAEIDKVRVSCLMNVQYHASREANLDSLHRWFMFAVIALGAGALADVAVKELPWVKEAFAAGAAILAALDLTFDLSNRARAHAMMKRRYFELMADLIEGKRSPSETRACIDRFGSDEEPPFRALLLASWNSAQETVYGDDALCYHIPRWHRSLRQVFRFSGTKFELAKP